MAYVVNSQHSTYIITDEVQEAGDQRIFYVSLIKFDQVTNCSYSRWRTHKKITPMIHKGLAVAHESFRLHGLHNASRNLSIT